MIPVRCKADLIQNIKSASERWESLLEEAKREKDDPVYQTIAEMAQDVIDEYDELLRSITYWRA